MAWDLSVKTRECETGREGRNEAGPTAWTKKRWERTSSRPWSGRGQRATGFFCFFSHLCHGTWLVGSKVLQPGMGDGEEALVLVLVLMLMPVFDVGAGVGAVRNQ